MLNGNTTRTTVIDLGGIAEEMKSQPHALIWLADNDLLDIVPRERCASLDVRGGRDVICVALLTSRLGIKLMP